MTEDKKYISLEDFKNIIDIQDGHVHTFRDSGGALIGADWGEETILETAGIHQETIELSGKYARAMEHGVAFRDDHGFVYVATNEERLLALENKEK